MGNFWCLLLGHTFFRYLPGTYGPRVRIYTESSTGKQRVRCWRCGDSAPLYAMGEEEPR